MQKTQPDRTDESQRPILSRTDPDQSDAAATLPVSELGTAGETCDMPSAARTASASVRGDEGSSPSHSVGITFSLDSEAAQADTERPASGNATIDSPPSGGRTGTLEFSLDSIEDSDRTLPPGAEAPLSKLPMVAGYEIVGILGQGGMGIVFKARQVRLDRFVALKMIRAGAGARPQELARFEAEAQAVAAIEHPNIVRIFEIGEYADMPFCSLEYLSGGSLAKLIGGKPQPVAEAARILTTLASAMEVAHKRGIVHRDLKPANVLIAADGTLKVTDFGLVKRLEDDSSQTRTGSILGTPNYMSPEQAKGETHNVGPAADQYALGAILYELLTGRPPFQGASVLDTLDQVRKKEPVPPSQLQTKIPRDLETICLKCLEKDPSRRYPDVTALAEDLRRYQAGEPIVARPVSKVERLWRWCLRNKAVASLIATAAALLIVVAAVSTTAAVVYYQQKTAIKNTNVALEKAKDLAEDQRKVAETKRQLAEKAAWAAISQNRASVDGGVALLELLEDKLSYVPALDEVRQAVLDRTITRLDDAAHSMTSLRKEIGWGPQDEENNWKSLARARQRLAELSLSQNRVKDALEQFKRLDELIEARSKDDPTDLERQIRVAKIRRQRGFVALNRLGDSALAENCFRQAIEIDRACLEKEPENDKFKIDLANSLGQLAMAKKQLGHLEKARDLFAEEEQVRKSFTREFAQVDEVRRQLAGMYEQKGDLKIRMNEPEEARRFYDLSTEIRKEVLSERPGDWPRLYDVALSYHNAAFLRFPQGHEPAAARVLYRKALDLIEERAKSEPSNLVTQGALATMLYYDATCALHAGDRSAAAIEYRRSLEIRTALATDPTVKMPQVDLMVALARCGEHAKAAKIAEMLAAIPPTNENFYFQAACGYALAAGCVPNDAHLARRYTSGAIVCLHKAKETGWNVPQSLEIDPDLEPIRNDPQFKALVAEFKKPK